MKTFLCDTYAHLHQNPELSGKEEKTQAFILKLLHEMGIETQTYPDQYAVVGIIRGGHTGKTVALRADMDALPISEKADVPYASRNECVMHACGHDAHMTIALGAAMILNAKKASLHGNVLLLFEPSEETVGGGKFMVEAGCMDEPHVDAVLGLHMNPDFDLGTIYTKAGPVSGSSTDVRINITGHACHGAYPERGVDAIVIAAQVVAALQTLVSRNVSPLDSAVLSIGQIEGGTASNVVCEKVSLHGTLRTLEKSTEQMLRERIKDVVMGIAKSLGGCGEVLFRDSYQSVYNNEKLHRLLEELVDSDKLIIRKNPSLGVESFSFFTARADGLYYDLGCGKGTPIHTDTFKIDTDVLQLGAELQARLCESYLNGGENE